MSSSIDIEAAAIFAHLFRSTISGDVGEQSRPLILHPILVGLLAEPQPDEGAPPSPPHRIYLVDPVSRGVAVLRGDSTLFAEMLSGIQGPPPASKASIEALTMVETIEDGEECTVCLNMLRQAPGIVDEDEAHVEVKEMPCRHRFHGACVEKWLGMHGTCPICRFCMPEEEVTVKKAEGDADEPSDGFERAIWFEVTFGRRETGDQDTEQGEEHDS